ncbi:MAG TPA: tetratricopeptide repeat protein [Pyrinomonadaceae bacterium]|nr:tetratricopeptide repeat protein [Pyrinomonadaceae bacterium]
MAFEKAKVLKAAEKFLSQGKINAAIKEYRQVVEHDDSDLSTLNMLGDLLARAGNKDEAISCFSRIAEHYREQQFTLKAIAMYKKIERLKPRDLEVAGRLADLYAFQGLVVDARAQYLIVADGYTRAGDAKRMLEVLHKIADLDPHNTEIRLKLADGYLKEGLESEAVAAFLEAGERLFEIGEFEKSLDSYAKVLELRPNDGRALRGIVSAHVALGTADEAAEILTKAVEATPEDTALTALLAQTQIDAENPRGAEEATLVLMSHDASNYTRFIEIARLYLKLGEVNDAVRVLGSIIEQMLAGREENDLLELVNEVLARDPEHVGALRLLVRIHWWQRDMDNLRSSLERLAEAAQAAGLVEDERYALTQLVRLAPEDRQYDGRLGVIGGLEEEEEADTGGFDAEEVEADEAAPSYESFAIVNGETSHDTDTKEQSAPALEFEWNSVAEATAPDPSSSFAELNATDEDLAYELSSGQEVDFSSAVVDSESNASAETASSEVDEARRESLMRQELESVDFYLAQGYHDIAIDTLDLLERQFGLNTEIQTRREKIAQATSGAKTGTSESEFTFTIEEPAESPDEIVADIDSAFTLGEEVSESAPVVSTGNDGTAVAGIDSGLAEIFEEFRVAAEEEQTTVTEDYETHYNMGTAYKEMDLLDEAIQEFQAAVGLTTPNDGTSRFLQCCNMLGHCFLQKGMPQAAVIWFKKGLDLPGQNQAESLALRYELGAAYEQMGDFKRAQELYTEVYGVDVSYREVAERLNSLHGQKKKRKK